MAFFAYAPGKRLLFPRRDRGIFLRIRESARNPGAWHLPTAYSLVEATEAKINQRP